ncbi:MAG: glycosyltransferase family 4 protein [Planctomycetes bacterium]|nr:glycosyltransferase family 4 protein [Planctomycetota bacterium]
MRILLVSHGLPPDSVGGVEQHVSGLAAALAAAGHEVEVLARWHGPGRAQGSFEQTVNGNPAVFRITYRWEGVDSLAAMYTCAPMADGVAAFLAARAAAGARYDVAHVHHLTGMSVDSLAKLRAAGVPTVLTLHDYWLFCPRGQMFHKREEVCETATVARCADCLKQTFPWWLKNEPEAQVQALHQRALATLAIPQRLVVPSGRAAPPFVALGVPAARIAVVENGVDTERLERLPAPAAGPGPLRLGYFGTVMPSKGLDVLIRAVLALPRGTVELHVHGNVVPYHGDESYTTKCLMQLEPGCGVTYHGPYSLDELAPRMASVDVLAAPALWHEAFGLTVREALAAGRPVLVSRVGGLQDAVADGQQGRVLPPGDVPAWTAAIRELAEDRGLVARWSAAARGRARGFAAMADDLVRVYAAARTGTD